MIHLMLQYVEVSAFLGLTFDTDCCTEHIIWFVGSIFRAIHNCATAVPMALKQIWQDRPTTCLTTHMFLSFLLKALFFFKKKIKFRV